MTLPSDVSRVLAELRDGTRCANLYHSANSGASHRSRQQGKKCKGVGNFLSNSGEWTVPGARAVQADRRGGRDCGAGQATGPRPTRAGRPALRSWLGLGAAMKGRAGRERPRHRVPGRSPGANSRPEDPVHIPAVLQGEPTRILLSISWNHPGKITQRAGCSAGDQRSRPAQ